jgi:ABC-type uncharacterized transport system substrate-binding protein
VSVVRLMDRRVFVTGVVATVAQAHAATGQPVRMYCIGLLHATGGRGSVEDFLEKRLGDFGWVDGRNVSLLYRYGQTNDALPALANELVARNPDVIVTGGTPASLAAKNATMGIPVVFYSVGDPVGVGLVTSLGRPGGNVTGIRGVTYQLGAKRLELLRQVLPEARRFGVLLNSTDPTVTRVLETLKADTRGTNVAVEPFYAGRPTDLDAAFQGMKRRAVNAVLVQPDGMFWAQRARIVRFAADLHLPAIYACKEDADAGGLMWYGASIPGMLDQALQYVDKILKGAKPGDLPVQESTKLELVVNIKTAKALGLSIPPSPLLRTDQVIE